MTLSEFKEKNDYTLAEMAILFDSSIPMLSQIINGNRQPSLSLMRRIDKMTKGRVGMNSWRET